MPEKDIETQAEINLLDLLRRTHTLFNERGREESEAPHRELFEARWNRDPDEIKRLETTLEKILARTAILTDPFKFAADLLEEQIMAGAITRDDLRIDLEKIFPGILKIIAAGPEESATMAPELTKAEERTEAVILPPEEEPQARSTIIYDPEKKALIVNGRVARAYGREPKTLLKHLKELAQGGVLAPVADDQTNRLASLAHRLRKALNDEDKTLVEIVPEGGYRLNAEFVILTPKAVSEREELQERFLETPVILYEPTEKTLSVGNRVVKKLARGKESRIYQLLSILSQQKEPVSASALLVLMGFEGRPTTNITRLITEARKYIEPNKKKPQFLVFIPGEGYQLKASFQEGINLSLSQAAEEVNLSSSRVRSLIAESLKHPSASRGIFEKGIHFFDNDPLSQRRQWQITPAGQKNLTRMATIIGNSKMRASHVFSKLKTIAGKNNGTSENEPLELDPKEITFSKIETAGLAVCIRNFTQAQLIEGDAAFTEIMAALASEIETDFLEKETNEKKPDCKAIRSILKTKLTSLAEKPLALIERFRGNSLVYNILLKLETLPQEDRKKFIERLFQGFEMVYQVGSDGIVSQASLIAPC